MLKMAHNGPAVEGESVNRLSTGHFQVLQTEFITVQGGYGAAFAYSASGYWRRGTFDEILLSFEIFYHY
jgi:hypothetical protein